MKFEAAVIGAGPGGYETAIRLHQKGINVVLFEKNKMGGECLNWGCIPTKAMVKSAEMFNEVHHLQDFGINVENVSLDFKRLMNRKNEVVGQLGKGLDYIFNKRKIPVMKERVVSIGEEEGHYIIETVDEHSESEDRKGYTADYVVIATGSKPTELSSLPFDSKYLLSSRDILDLNELPAHLTIIGGGTIGCEFASIFSNLGVKIEIIELLPTLLCYEDNEIAKKLTSNFKKKGIAVHTNTMIERFVVQDDKVVLTTNKGKEIITDKVLISTGRVPCCDIEFKMLNVSKEKGKVVINDEMETGHKNLFAIGDVTGMLMLAHTASKQGLMVADIIEKRMKNTDYEHHPLTYCNIPRCTFTDPELASVGLTEQQAMDSGRDIIIGKFSYLANGKALALGCKDGFIKVIADKKERTVIGMHIIGSQATELIALGSIIINMYLKIDDLHKVVYAHPTVSEVVMEAIEDLSQLAIHKI